MKLSATLLASVFPLAMILNAIADLRQPVALQEQMDAIEMPHYMLIILGVAKLAGGLTLLFAKGRTVCEWAYAGFFIWGLGGIACLLSTSSPLGSVIAILVPISFLSASYAIDLSRGNVQAPLQLRAP